MIAYCTHCWREVSSADTVCPKCKADLTLDNRTYEEKLIGALAHPLPEARVRICWLIGKNHTCEAVPDLMRLAMVDEDLFVRRAALETLGELKDTRAMQLLREVSRCDNRFLAATALKSLQKIGEKNDCVSCSG